ncbi:MAG: hypothetical protein K2H64_07305 [Desulfovibrio sp.]|nr:hypothetical protein [Desulfovibrio sp.]
MVPWQEIYSDIPLLKNNDYGSVAATDLASLKSFLDAIHIRNCLVRPYQEISGYPLVEARELLPSFENAMQEYSELPGFSLVAFARPLEYFSEIFQFDKLHSITDSGDGSRCPLENQVADQNLRALCGRLPKKMQDKLRYAHRGMDVTLLDNYETLLPYLLEMDRAQVLALDKDKLFHLAGVFASFPSDIDSELKRFGIKIGKFVYGDHEMYERNRMFVYQYLMELYGFPIVSERRTSSALFARKLHKMGENFLLRVLGQSDRTITTYVSNGENRRFPTVEKIALVAVGKDQEEAFSTIDRKGFFLDKDRRVVIIRVVYRQHRYNPDNLRQDRALSVAAQEILHPRTGEILSGLNIIKDETDMFLRLNDIVRGEYYGKIVYKRSEIVENTDTDEKRLKFLYTWLNKHNRRMIGNNDKFYHEVSKVLTGYLNDVRKKDSFDSARELHQEVCGRFSYIQQARRVRALQDLTRRTHKGKRITYRKMIGLAVKVLGDLQFELGNYFPELAEMAIRCAETILCDKYLERRYLSPPDCELTESGREIKMNYGRLVSILDSVKAICKRRARSDADKAGEAVSA